MSQSTSKSASYLRIWSTLEVRANQGTNPCFRAWSTLALFDYFQNGIPLRVERESDPSTEGEQSQIDKSKEAVRTELQDLLRRAYRESSKAGRDKYHQ